MRELVDKWRDRADAHAKSDNTTSKVMAGVLRSCADELEKAVHDNDHDAFWRDWCPFCEKEQREHGDPS